jgi:hypothetical protein
MVLQSANVSSSAEFDDSLLTMTMLSAKFMPARSKSSILWNHKITMKTKIYHSWSKKKSGFFRGTETVFIYIYVLGKIQNAVSAYI